jgi:glycosyltransferase involved in cell wall biosynthesis
MGEALPRALIEAQSCGVPVLTTNCGGAEEVVLDSGTGFVVDAQCYSDFQTCLERLCADRVLREEMGSRARRHVVQNFSLEASDSRVIQIYQSCDSSSRA